MNSASGRLFVSVLLTLMGLKSRPKTPVAPEPTNVRRQSLAEVATNLSGRFYWIQDDADGACLGPDGSFGSCGDSLWHVYGRPGSYQFAAVSAGVETAEGELEADDSRGKERRRAARDAVCLNRVKCHWPTGPVDVTTRCNRCGAKRWDVDAEGRISQGSVFSGRKCIMRTPAANGSVGTQDKKKLRLGKTAEMAPCSALSTRFRLVEFLPPKQQGTGTGTGDDADADADAASRSADAARAAETVNTSALNEFALPNTTVDVPTVPGSRMKPSHAHLRAEALKQVTPTLSFSYDTSDGALDPLPDEWVDPDSGISMKTTLRNFLRPGTSVIGRNESRYLAENFSWPEHPQHKEVSPLPKDETGHYVGTDDPVFDQRGAATDEGHGAKSILLGAGPFTWYLGIRFYTVALYVDVEGAAAAAVDPNTALHQAYNLAKPFLPELPEARSDNPFPSRDFVKRSFDAMKFQPLVHSIMSVSDWMLYGRTMVMTMNKWVPASVMCNAMRKEWKTIGLENLEVLLRSAQRLDVQPECCKAGTTMTFTWEPRTMEFSVRLDGYLVDVITDEEGSAFLSRQMFEQYTREDSITPLARERIAVGIVELVRSAQRSFEDEVARRAASDRERMPGGVAAAGVDPHDRISTADLVFASNRTFAEAITTEYGNTSEVAIRAYFTDRGIENKLLPGVPLELYGHHLRVSMQPDSSGTPEEKPSKVRPDEDDEAPPTRRTFWQWLLRRPPSPRKPRVENRKPAAELLAAVAEGESSIEDYISVRRGGGPGIGLAPVSSGGRAAAKTDPHSSKHPLDTIHAASRGPIVIGADAESPLVAEASPAHFNPVASHSAVLDSEWDHILAVFRMVFADNNVGMSLAMSMGMELGMNMGVGYAFDTLGLSQMQLPEALRGLPSRLGGGIGPTLNDAYDFIFSGPLLGLGLGFLADRSATPKCAKNDFRVLIQDNGASPVPASSGRGEACELPQGDADGLPSKASKLPPKQTRWQRPWGQHSGGSTFEQSTGWWSRRRQNAIEASLWRALRSLFAFLYCVLLAVLSLPSSSRPNPHPLKVSAARQTSQSNPELRRISRHTDSRWRSRSYKDLVAEGSSSSSAAASSPSAAAAVPSGKAAMGETSKSRSSEGPSSGAGEVVQEIHSYTSPAL